MLQGFIQSDGYIVHPESGCTVYPSGFLIEKLLPETALKWNHVLLFCGSCDLIPNAAEFIRSSLFSKSPGSCCGPGFHRRSGCSFFSL